MNISEMLSRNARMYPDAPALIELTPAEKLRKEITWKEFDRRANKVANSLMDMGVRKGDKVAHLMMNSIDWLAAFFGIIRTGAWAVPLNFRFTGRDIKYCVDASEPKVMLLGQEFLERVQAVRSRIPAIEKYICAGKERPEGMESLEELLKTASDRAPGVELAPQDECGLYFTSGTMGAPKPILLTHANMESAAVTEQAHHYQTRDDNYILIPPLYHTGSKMHWFGSLLSGGRATILNGVSPEYIFEAVAKERGTIVWLLVPWIYDILGALDRGEMKKEAYDLSSWRLMHTGAQPVPPGIVRRWKRYFPEMQFDNNYGLSESTGPGCIHLGLENDKYRALGKPGLDWKVRIVDDDGMDVPRGRVGEIIVKGDGVMKEYFKNPEQTAKTIRDGWLFTGDLGRWDEDGFIYITDRKKDVVIVGGENVYPWEVEEAIRQHPKVKDAAVISLPDDRLVEVVGAVVEVKSGETLKRMEVNEFCEKNLPRYKRPRRVMFGTVPRDSAGKIEKWKLREKYTGQKECIRIEKS
ncbi:MAG: AMP-binding protein [Chloroflexi bacterium]|nr:AMP-binding protein [Chloroflexota bacterium]